VRSDDIRRWLNWLENQERRDACMGWANPWEDGIAGVAAREPRFCAIVASRRRSFREEAYYLGRPFHTVVVGRTFFRPPLEAGILFVRLWYGVDSEPLRGAGGRGNEGPYFADS